MQPLDGVRILAVEAFLSGPFGSTFLASFGAEVIRVERPPIGDPERAKAPVISGPSGQMSYNVARINRNKQSILLDLNSESGREVFLDLVDTSDVVWENLRGGAMASLGLGWEVLHARNPRLIYASVSGFGQPDFLPSPYQDRRAFDLVGQALGGLMTEVGGEGDPPMYLGVPMTDQMSGMFAAFGVLLALQARDATGRGQQVDVSMYDVMVALNEQAVSYYGHFGTTGPRGASPTAAPYGAYRCKDGWFVLAVSSEDGFQKCCVVLDAPDLIEDPRLANGMGRSEHREDILRPRIEAWAADQSAEEVARRFNSAGVPAAPIRTVEDLFSCPHLAARNMLVRIDDPIMGPITVAGNPIKIGGLAETAPRPAPLLGEHQRLHASGIEAVVR